jgi:LuxR family maltose regulon positive regulatory protein
MLADLARSNLLLIPLDDEGVWFRHHHLLRDVLRSELSATMPDRQRHLHSRACEWFQRNEAPSEAIHHAVESGDVAGAAELVAANFWPVLTNGRLATGSRWIARLPQSLIEEYPPLTVCASYIAAFGGDFPLAYRLCELATAARFEGAPPDGTTSHESSVALLRGALYPAGVSDALHYATSAYRLEPPGSPWKRTSAAVLGGALLANGDFAEASEILAEAADGAEPQPAIRSYALGQTALLECWRGDSLRARDSVDRAVQLIERFRLANSATSAPAFAVAAALAARSGRPDSARRHQDMAEAAASQGFPDLLLEVSVVNAETSLGLGDPARAAWDLAIGAKALTVLGDGGYYADRLAPLLAEVDGVVPQKRGQGSRDELTARERQILSLLPSDLTVREIGHQLYISRNTAKTHVARIFRKLDCRTREDAVAIAHDRGLL